MLETAVVHAQRFALATLLGAAASCLPGDTRPEPGSLVVTVEPSDATRNGFVTSDGWTIRFEHLFTAVGDVDLGPDPDGLDTSCNDYSETNYERLFDFAIAGRERVGIVYGLGTCSAEWRMRGPSEDVVLGTGATADVASLMRLEVPDDYSDGRRASLYVVGEATRGAERKRFEWVFRRGYAVDRCLAASGTGYASVLDVAGGDEKSIALEVRGEELFRRAPTDDAPLVFDSYAAADADADGTIAFAELGAIPASTEDGWTPPPPDDERDPANVDPPPETLADTVYVWSLPRLTRVVGGGECTARLRGGFRGFGGF